jgi:hypothetical protein
MSRSCNFSPPAPLYVCCGTVFSLNLATTAFLRILSKLLFIHLYTILACYHLSHDSSIWAVAFLRFFFSSLHFLTTVLLRDVAVNSIPNPQPRGPGLRICDPWRQGDPAVPPDTVPTLVAFYDTHELRWVYSYPPVTKQIIISYILSYQHHH